MECPQWLSLFHRAAHLVRIRHDPPEHRFRPKPRGAQALGGDDHADARALLVDGNEPAPTILVAHDDDVAARLAGGALDPGEMPVQGDPFVERGVCRRGRDRLVKEPIAPAGIHEVRATHRLTRRPKRDLVAIPPDRPHGAHAGLLPDGAAEFGCVFEQEQIEARTLHLVRVFQPRYHPLRELDVPGQRAAVADVELRAILLYEPRALHLVPCAGLAQDRIGHWHQRLADVEAREPLFLDDEHTQPRPREVRPGRAAGGAAADDHGVEIRGEVGGVHVMGKMPKNRDEVKTSSAGTNSSSGVIWCDN